MIVESLTLSPCHAIGVLWSHRSGKKSKPVSLSFESYEIILTGNYADLCSIEVDLSHLFLSPRPKYSGEGTFYCLEYDIVLLFGLTELELWPSGRRTWVPSWFYCVLFTYSVSRELNDEVPQRIFTIQIPWTTLNFISAVIYLYSNTWVQNLH
jgi:hypothetical protein